MQDLWNIFLITLKVNFTAAVFSFFLRLSLCTPYA